MPQNSIEQEAMERVSRMYAPFSAAGRPNGQNAPRRNRGDSARGGREERHDVPRADPQPDGSLHDGTPEGTLRDGDPPEHPDSGLSRGGKNLLDGLFEDSERSLILLLIALLQADGADAGLLLALIYLVM